MAFAGSLRGDFAWDWMMVLVAISDRKTYNFGKFGMGGGGGGSRAANAYLLRKLGKVAHIKG